MGMIQGGMFRAGMVGILTMLMGIFLVGCGEEDVSRVNPSEFYAVPESRGPSELPTVVGPSSPPPSD